MVWQMTGSEFGVLRSEILRFPRLRGYYKIEMSDISDLRVQAVSLEKILDHLYDLWGEHEALEKYRQIHPFPKPKPEDLPSWVDHEGDADDAVELLAYGLQGGGAVGHTIDAIPPALAQEFAERFVSFFDHPRMFRGLGFGDPMYVFEHGIVLIDETKAGMLLIIESD